MTDFADVRQAIAQNDPETARELLRPLLENHADTAEVWFLASEAARNEAQRRYFLEKAVEIDPLFHQAANALHRLNAPTLPLETPAASPEARSPKYASFGKRLLAFLLDELWQFAFVWLLLQVAAFVFPQLEIQLFTLVFQALFVHWLYHAYYFTQRDGQTFGTRLLRLRFIRRDGKALNWRDAFMLGVIGYLSLIVSLGVGFLWIAFNEQRQSWQDIIADTFVLEVES